MDIIVDKKGRHLLTNSMMTVCITEEKISKLREFIKENGKRPEFICGVYSKGIDEVGDYFLIGSEPDTGFDVWWKAERVYEIEGRINVIDVNDDYPCRRFSAVVDEDGIEHHSVMVQYVTSYDLKEVEKYIGDTGKEPELVLGIPYKYIKGCGDYMAFGYEEDMKTRVWEKVERCLNKPGELCTCYPDVSEDFVSGANI